jgi:uncharacterized protein
MLPGMSRPVALVTGPTAGIGRSFAVQLAGDGHDLVLVARDVPRLEALADDLADRSQLARVEDRLAATERPVDLLVNNAGFGLRSPFLTNQVDDEQRLLDVLVTAVLRLSHAALRSMVARGSGGVINVSSVAAFLPRGTYSAAKAYVNQFSRWADATYRGEGVRVMALCPGFTRTEFHERMEVSRSSAPGWMWLDADRLVREGLADFAAGRSLSVPTKRYKVLAAAARYVPTGVLSRFQSVGR